MAWIMPAMATKKEKNLVKARAGRLGVYAVWLQGYIVGLATGLQLLADYLGLNLQLSGVRDAQSKAQSG